jgi:hypothetical protein
LREVLKLVIDAAQVARTFLEYSTTLAKLYCRSGRGKKRQGKVEEKVTRKDTKWKNMLVSMKAVHEILLTVLCEIST